MNDNNTEIKILEAAKSIFLIKGMNGARMQEIADKAKINKAMLHYYFKSKQILFEAVFLNAFKQLAPQLNAILNDDNSIEDKIRNFTNSYLSFLIKHPYLPRFIIQEMNRSPEFFETHMAANFPSIEKFRKQVELEVKQGKIEVISAEHLFVNILSMCLFPVIGSGMVKAFLRQSDDDYHRMMEDRKTSVAESILNSIKI